jgi:hypothetical protein
VIHEIVLHHIFCFEYSQLSQHFVSGHMLHFVERPDYVGDELCHSQCLEHIERASSEYAALSDRSVGIYIHTLPIGWQVYWTGCKQFIATL